MRQIRSLGHEWFGHCKKGAPTKFSENEELEHQVAETS